MARRHRWAALVAVAAVAVTACGDGSGETTTTSTTTSTSLPAATVANTLITRDGIGSAPTGQTVEGLRAALGPGFEIVTGASILAGTDGVEVRHGGVIQYYALRLLHEGEDLDILFTQSPSYRTAAGIGPGSSLDEAVAAYGPPRFSYSVVDQKRELVQFADGPAPNIVFRAAGPGGDETAGVYAEPLADFNEATSYRPGSTIDAVWVFHDPQGEPGDPSTVTAGEYRVDVDAGSSLNIRSGPGTGFEVLAEFTGGGTNAVATGRGVFGDDGTEWWEVELPDGIGTGWVAADFLVPLAAGPLPMFARTVPEVCTRLHEAWRTGATGIAETLATADAAAALFSRDFTPSSGQAVGGGERWCFYDNGTEFAEVLVGHSAGNAIATGVAWYPAEEFLADDGLVERFNGAPAD